MVDIKPENRPTESNTLSYFNQIKFNKYQIYYQYLLHDLKLIR